VTLSVTAYNGTTWEIRDIVVEVSYEGDTNGRVYTMPFDLGTFGSALVGLGIGLKPSASGKFTVDLGLDPGRKRVNWQLVGAHGNPPTQE
jgi:hypothetical protein